MGTRTTGRLECFNLSVVEALKMCMPTLTKKKKRTYPHTPNYIVLLPPGEILSEKLSEMELDVKGLAECSGLSIETIQGLLKAEIAVTQVIAEKLEKATRIA